MTSKNARRRARRARKATHLKTVPAATVAQQTPDDQMTWLVPQELPWLQAS